MLLLDIEKQVKPLSLSDKERLIRDVQRMVEEETLRQWVRADTPVRWYAAPPADSGPADAASECYRRAGRSDYRSADDA